MLRLCLALAVGVVALVTSGLVASMARAQAGTAADPASVIGAYETARNRQDVDGALAYFADDATITQRGTTYTGKAEIRKYLEAVSARARYGVVTDRQTSGNRVSWIERAGGLAPGQSAAATAVRTGTGTGTGTGSGSGVPSHATFNGQGFVLPVEAVVQDGKIRSLAYLPNGTNLRTDPSLDDRAQVPASVGLGAVVMVMLGVLMAVSVGFGRSPGSASTLRGRLMHDLQGWSAARQ